MDLGNRSLEALKANIGMAREFWGTGHLLNSNPNFDVPVEAGGILL